MKSAGATQTDLANALDLTQSAVSTRIRGVVAFNVEELAAVARLLDCALSDLVDTEPASDSEPASLPAPINIKPISAYTTGRDMDGERYYRLVHLEIDPARTELNFRPATDGVQALARVHYRKWDKGLRRYDWFPQLVIQDSISAVNIQTFSSEVPE